MSSIDERIQAVAEGQHFLVTRDEVLDLGGSDDVISRKLLRMRWQRLHAGVYQVDSRPLTRDAELYAAVLACGPDARVSHRAAVSLWELDGPSGAPIEVTMGFGNLGYPAGVIVHRSRRPTPAREVRGLPVSGPERSLLEAARFLGERLIGKALDSTIRKGLTDVDRVSLMLASEGGRGVPGTRRLRRVLSLRSHDEATDSGPEFELLSHMQRADLPRPELGFELFPESGRRIPDFCWPGLRKAVEVDGVDTHSSADRLDDDLKRQNEILDLGYEIRRFSARGGETQPRRRGRSDQTFPGFMRSFCVR